MTEAEAAETLNYLTRRREPRDALTEFLDQAPIDDEPISEEEERAVQEARDEIARGQTISLAQLKMTRPPATDASSPATTTNGGCASATGASASPVAPTSS